MNQAKTITLLRGLLGGLDYASPTKRQLATVRTELQAALWDVTKAEKAP